MMTRRFLISTLFVLGALLMRDAAQAQERLTDTLRVVDALINPGDTGNVYIYIANSEQLGGYTLRIAYDTSVLEVVTLSESDPIVPAVQLWGDFRIFLFQMPEPGVVAGTAAFVDPVGLEVGSRNEIQLPFYVKEYAELGANTQIVFENAPFDTNASNWFSAFSGLYQYRPTRIPGTITFGLVVNCPDDITVGCDESIDPLVTGEATVGDPTATITYSDAEVAGPCAQESTIIRTWTARDDEETTCDQTIYVVDEIPPEITCPEDMTIQFGGSIDPAHTGYAIAADNCDEEAWVSYEDVETAADFPVEKVITRTWTASDHCDNTQQCVQVINELVENIPNSITCPEDVVVDCDESTDPANTGEAIPLNPEATISYVDSLIAGSCPPGFTIIRTWTADLSGDDVSCSQTISVIDTDSTIREVKLAQNYPNPFVIGEGKNTFIDYDVPSPGRVNISIYDTVGRRMKTLVNEDKPASSYTTSWDGRDAEGNYVPSGVYIYRLEYGGESIIKKMAVIR